MVYQHYLRFYPLLILLIKQIHIFLFLHKVNAIYTLQNVTNTHNHSVHNHPPPNNASMAIYIHCHHPPKRPPPQPICPSPQQTPRPRRVPNSDPLRLAQPRRLQAPRATRSPTPHPSLALHSRPRLLRPRRRHQFYQHYPCRYHGLWQT